MSQAKRLSKIKFYSISRDIRDGRRSNVEMANFHGVSTGTIRTVRISKTWKGFEEYKKAVVAKALQRKVELGKERAAAHGLKVTEPAAARTIGTAVAYSVTRPLDGSGTPLYKADRFDQLTEHLEEAVGRLNTAIFKLEKGMVEPKQRRRTFWSKR